MLLTWRDFNRPTKYRHFCGFQIITCCLVIFNQTQHNEEVTWENIEIDSHKYNMFISAASHTCENYSFKSINMKIRYFWFTNSINCIPSKCLYFCHFIAFSLISIHLYKRRKMSSQSPLRVPMGLWYLTIVMGWSFEKVFILGNIYFRNEKTELYKFFAFSMWSSWNVTFFPETLSKGIKLANNNEIFLLFKNLKNLQSCIASFWALQI